MKKILLLAAMLAVVSLCGSFALALSPMGPPAAGLDKGQYSAGVDYSYGRVDLEMNHGRSPGGGFGLTANNVKEQYLLANLGYGIKDNIEGSFRIGGGAAQDKDGPSRKFETNREGYVFGFGLKGTYIEEPNIKWGGLIQLLRAKGEGKTIAGGSSWSTRIESIEIQIAAGPTYKLNEKASIYGGPFFDIVNGRYTAKNRAGSGRIRYSLDEGSVFGGYIGTEINATDNTVCRVEYQHTASADALGMSLLYRFK